MVQMTTVYGVGSLVGVAVGVGVGVWVAG